jgi:hypothetical protein
MLRSALYFVLLALLCLPASKSIAEANPVEDYVSDWVLGGMNPAAELCSDQRGYLGEFVLDDDAEALDRAIDAECGAKTDPDSNEPPLVIRGCFLSIPSLDELLYDPTKQPSCDCDLFFCDKEHAKTFENGVDALFKISKIFR